MFHLTAHILLFFDGHHRQSVLSWPDRRRSDDIGRQPDVDGNDPVLAFLLGLCSGRFVHSADLRLVDVQRGPVVAEVLDETLLDMGLSEVLQHYLFLKRPSAVFAQLTGPDDIPDLYIVTFGPDGHRLCHVWHDQSRQFDSENFLAGDQPARQRV